MRFAADARVLKFFSAPDVMYDRVGEPFLPKNWSAAWRETRAVFAVPHMDVPDLLHLLKDKDPRVRTLTLAALFHREDPKLCRACTPDRFAGSLMYLGTSSDRVRVRRTDGRCAAAFSSGDDAGRGAPRLGGRGAAVYLEP
jgi:hypothetical protein